MKTDAQYIEEIDALQQDDADFDDKLAQIAAAMAKTRAAKKPSGTYAAPVDPQDALACEGCQ